MDVKEQGDDYLVHAELPGVKKEDIHVVVDGNQVSVSAEVKQEKEVKEGERVLRSERYFRQGDPIVPVGSGNRRCQGRCQVQ